MPEEFSYVQNDPYAKYVNHLAILGHGYKDTLFAESLESPEFTITPSTGQRLITIGLAVHQLIGNINRTEPMVVALVGPETIPPIMRTTRNTPDIEFSVGQNTYLSTRKENHGILKTAEGTELARITPVWKDSETDKGIKFWIHSYEPLPPLIAALFFCLAQTYEAAGEYGMSVAY